MKHYLKTLLLLFFLLTSLCKVRSQSADSSRYFYLKAMEEKSNRLYQPAYNDFQHSLEYDSLNTDALRAAGLTAVELRKYENAIVAFEKLVAVRKKDTTAVSQLAILYFWTHRWEKAVSYATLANQLHAGQNNYYILHLFS